MVIKYLLLRFRSSIEHRIRGTKSRWITDHNKRSCNIEALVLAISLSLSISTTRTFPPISNAGPWTYTRHSLHVTPETNLHESKAPRHPIQNNKIESTNVSRFAYFLQSALTQFYVYIDLRQALRDRLSSRYEQFLRMFYLLPKFTKSSLFFDYSTIFLLRLNFLPHNR